ncbi:uncharacterized protein [Acropora muricata]
MAQDEWGDHRILFAAANWSQCNIRVISSIPSHEVTISPLHPNSDADVLVLGHVVELHYVSLRRPTSDSPNQVQEEPGDSRDWSLSSLGIADFKADIDFFGKFYDEVTRRWLFADFYGWFRDPGDSRAYVLLGDAGVGKSVIAAALVKHARGHESFGACYFCLQKDTLRSDPRNLIGSVAYQLCEYIEEYRTNVGGRSRVIDILTNSALGLIELFTKLLQEPLGKCNMHSKRMLVIIDALDETNHESRKDFFYVLRERFPLLPKWLVFFITSRPEDTVKFNLQGYNPCIKICAGNDQDEVYYRQHKEDIKQFLMKQVNFSKLPYTVEEVVAKCNGMFLYARYISQELNDPTSSIEGANLDDLFPGDIEGYFLNNFDQICDKLGEDLYGKLFGCAIAAPAPFPFPFISCILEKENSNLNKKTVIDAVSRFVVRNSDKTFRFLHNLIPLWLTNEEKARELFIDRGKASEYLKEIILTFLPRAFSDQLEGGVSINPYVCNYLLRVGVRFLCNYDNEDTMKTVFSCLTSFHFLQKKVNIDRLEIFAVVSDCKCCLQCQYLADEEKLMLEEIYRALKKTIYVLVDCPLVLPSCLRLTSERTQRKLAVSGDTLMMCKSLDCLPYPASILSCEDGVFALSPDKKLLAAGNRVTEIVRMYDACSLKEVLGPVDCQMKIDYLAFSPDGKFLLFGKDGVGLSLERGGVEEIFTSYEEKRVLDQGRHHGRCLAYAFLLWAELEFFEGQGMEMICCLLTVAKVWSPMKEVDTIFDGIDHGSFYLRRDKMIHFLREGLCLIMFRMGIDCEDCRRYYEQEPSLTALIQRIAGMHPFDYLHDFEVLLLGPFNSEFLTLCVTILRSMKAQEFPSSLPLKLRDYVILSPNGKLIAVRDPRSPGGGGHTIKVFLNLTETGETVSFPDPVHVIKDVEASAFTRNRDFVVYVQKEGLCFQALSLQTGSILSCDSGFSPVFDIKQSPQVGFVFRAGSEETIVSLSDFLVSSALRKYLVLPGVTSERTQRKLAVSGDTLMMCKSLDCLPYPASILLCEDGVFALSPDKKLLAAGNRNYGIVRMYDACSLKEVLGPVDCQMKIDYLAFSPDGKFLLFGKDGVGLSVERGGVEEIFTSYEEKRVLDQGRHHGRCLAYAFLLWAKLEFFEGQGHHMKMICCLLTVAKVLSPMKEVDTIFDVDDHGSFYLRRDKMIHFLREGLWLIKCCMGIDCEDCRRYYKQEPSLTALIQRIAGMHPFDYFRDFEVLLLGPFNSEFLTLCVTILRSMKAQEFPSSLPLKLRDYVILSPNGKLIAVRDPRSPGGGGHTIKVFMNLTETGETVSFPDPVHVIKDVEASAFTCNRDFVVYVQKEGRCFQALALQTCSILSCDSGFSPVFDIKQSPQVGFVFRAGSEETNVSLSDFLVSSALRKYLVLPGVTFTGSPSGITFTQGGNISYFISPNLTLCVVIRNGDGSFVTSAKWAPLKYPDGCKVKNCALSRKGKSIAISQKASIFLFDNHAFDCTVFKESEYIGCQVSCLMFSHDGTLLLYCVERRNSKAEVCLWNVDQKKLSSCFFASTLVSINCCCFSPDNSMVILCGELRVEIWEDVLCSRPCLKMVKELKRLYPSYERFHYCSVSSGNKVLACCIMDDVLLYSLSSPGEESFYCRLPPAHLGQIQFCQLLRETCYLISYGIDGAVFLWDLVQKKAVAFVRVAEGEETITGMSVSSTEDEVVCLTSLDKVIMIELQGLK